MRELDPPIGGVWPFDDLPEAVEIDGQTFYRAIRKQPYEGVIEQYREALSRDAAHMFVKDDGSFIVHHIDEYNPDMGYPVRHFLIDHPVGRLLVLTGTGIITMGIAVARGVRESRQERGIIKP